MAFYGNTWSSESMIAGHIGGHNMFGPCTGQWEWSVKGELESGW